MINDIYWATKAPIGVCGSEVNAKEEDNNNVEKIHNKIYFYAEVSRGKNLKLNLAINELSSWEYISTYYLLWGICLCRILKR